MISTIRVNPWLICGVLLMGAASFAAQDLPDTIRGYKVHEASPKVGPPIIRLGKPTMRLDGLLSVVVEAGGEFTSHERGGSVDFLTFHDIRVNGVAVDVEEYRDGFDFKKGKMVPLSKPIRGRIGLTSTVLTAYREMTDPRSDWRVTGTAFVFGKFKRFGLSFKRVVPVKLDFVITNPLR